MGPRSRCLTMLFLLAPALPAGPERADDHGTAVVVIGQEPVTPIPTLLTSKANSDVSELLFLRLARPGAGLRTADERSFEPQLARAWSRRDSLTLVFELDPRAKWQDGVPVTARDVLFSFARIRDSTVDPQRALLLRHLASVTAENDHRVVLRFRRAYADQFYDATYQVQLLPAHLVDTIPAARFASSSFARQPVGSGPYRWVRREPGRQLELAADPGFFLGAPKIDRVVFLVVRDPEAMMNLMLDGTGDAFEAVPPVSGPVRIAGNRALRIVPVPSLSVVYLLFNQRAYGDRSRPHPILADADVRRALAMAVDRTTLLRSTYGPYALPAEAPVAQAHWTRRLVPRGPAFDPGTARALLARRGWTDHDGDGVLDRDGVPLALRLNVLTSSGTRLTMAPQVQEQLRRLGVRIDIVRLEGPVWAERRAKGEFDIDFASAVMDPSPGGIVQSWSCAGRGGSNVAQYCDPAADSLLAGASLGAGDAERLWREGYARIQQDAPAVFLALPATIFAVHSRYRNVTLRPEALYADLWRWSVDPAKRIARDAAISGR